MKRKSKSAKYRLSSRGCSAENVGAALCPLAGMVRAVAAAGTATGAIGATGAAGAVPVAFCMFAIVIVVLSDWGSERVAGDWFLVPCNDGLVDRSRLDSSEMEGESDGGDGGVSMICNDSDGSGESVSVGNGEESVVEGDDGDRELSICVLIEMGDRLWRPVTNGDSARKIRDKDSGLSVVPRARWISALRERSGSNSVDSAGGGGDTDWRVLRVLGAIFDLLVG